METSEQKDKYYTPKIEEFHQGFEYEAESTCYPDKNNWHSETFYINSSHLQLVNRNTIFDNKVRVKYLDREDIESLGFIVKEEEVKSYGHYITATIKHDSYTTTLTYSFLKNKDKVYLHLSNSHFSGNGHYHIKNKSELRKLMYQLNILKDEK